MTPWGNGIGIEWGNEKLQQRQWLWG